MHRSLNFGAAFGLVLASAAGRAEGTEYLFTLIDYRGAGEWRSAVDAFAKAVDMRDGGDARS